MNWHAHRSGLGRAWSWVFRTCFLAMFLYPWAQPGFAQQRPYIGFVYPAGGQQGATFQIKLGGQALEDVSSVLITGTGVTGVIREYYRPLNPQEITLLNEQLNQLKHEANHQPNAAPSPETAGAAGVTNVDSAGLTVRIQKRLSEHVNRPASAALASLVFAEVTVAPDATPGRRELRLRTARGISNPVVFEVGRLPEYSRKPMITAPLQVLGKEELALRKRPPDKVEDRVVVPCTLNGQIASGERNFYRFAARAGQRLVLTVRARDLVPFIADAVPGWFQPVLTLYDAEGKEVAYDDDYRFKPDPTILYRVPRDGEYRVEIRDALYRGREDFVYRLTIGELPFVTSMFPLGGRAGVTTMLRVQGWNLETNTVALASDLPPGIHPVVLSQAEFDPLPIFIDSLPEVFEQEPNNSAARAQNVELPAVINGRVDRPGDEDVFRFQGRANEWMVAEVLARRLDSPLDSVLRLTDAAGHLLAFNDDCDDPEAGINTHPADSYLKARLPADGVYFVSISDAARAGGEAYGYRLRLREAQPDFDLRVVPSSLSLRRKSAAPLSVYLIRRDGFTNSVKISLNNPPAGFFAAPVSLSGTQQMARLMIRTDLVKTAEPENLTIIGTTGSGPEEIRHAAAPAEDRMQAFLWRHLVPALDLPVQVFDPNYLPATPRLPPSRVRAATNAPPTTTAASNPAKPRFTRQQVAARLRQLRNLFAEGLLTDEFYAGKVAECEAASADESK